MKSSPARGLPPRIVVPIVLCVAILIAIPIAGFLKKGFATEGSSIAPSDITTPPPAIAAALAELRGRIARNPRDVEALSSLAGLYAQIGQIDQASRLQAQAVKAAPDDVSLRDAYATLLRSAGKPREAIAQIDAVLKLQPKNADAYYERATIEVDLHERENVRKDMRKFLALADAHDPRRSIANAVLQRR